MGSVANSVLKRIRVHGRGGVFTPRDFLALGTRRAVDWALALGEALRFMRAAESQNYVLRHPTEFPIGRDVGCHSS